MTHEEQAPTLEEQAEAVTDRETLAAFVERLVKDLRQDPEAWPNDTLDLFLSAMAAWLDDMDGFYANRGETPPDPPTWTTLAQILLAARIYE